MPNPPDYDPFMDGTIEVPRLTIYKILSRHARRARFIELGAKAPSIVIEREEELIEQAIEELAQVDRDRRWFQIEYPE